MCASFGAGAADEDRAPDTEPNGHDPAAELLAYERETFAAGEERVRARWRRLGLTVVWLAEAVARGAPGWVIRQALSVIATGRVSLSDGS